jgi:hypothetical protein
MDLPANGFMEYLGDGAENEIGFSAARTAASAALTPLDVEVDAANDELSMTKAETNIEAPIAIAADRRNIELFL